VNNLPFTCTEALLREHFRAASGDVVQEVRLIRTLTGQVKGFAYVQLRERDLVPQVVQALHKSKLEGRTITVERS